MLGTGSPVMAVPNTEFSDENSKIRKENAACNFPHSPGAQRVSPFPIPWFFRNSLLREWDKLINKKNETF